MLVVALFSFWLCVFTLNPSAEHPPGMSDASPLVPQADCSLLHLHAVSLLWDGECTKDVSETMCQRMKGLHDFLR